MADLRAGLIRAIGEPSERFAEDKLRMLRCVRFAVCFDFVIEPRTWRALIEMTDQITIVSAERIAAEMRAMLIGPRRSHALTLLRDTGLLRKVLPELANANQEAWSSGLQWIDGVNDEDFPLALSALLLPIGEPGIIESIGARWKLSSKDLSLARWLLTHAGDLRGAAARPWSKTQRLLIHEGARRLVALHSVALATEGEADVDARFARQKLALPTRLLDPPPLLTGDDLLRDGWTAGPAFREVLTAVRDEQLDGRIGSPEEALQLARRLRDGQILSRE
jgi:poly(A) polymerase